MTDPTPPGSPQVRLTWQSLRRLYANAFHVTGAPGEVAILLGANPALAGGTEPTVRFDECVILSPAVAARLAEALARVLMEFDARRPHPDSLSPGGAGSRANLAGRPEPVGPQAARDQADFLLRLVDELGVPYGLERSLRLSSGGIQAGRFLASLHRRSLGEAAPAVLLDLAERLAMPADFQASMREHFEEADMVHLGFEPGGRGGLYKVYLERGEALRRDPPADPSAPRLLHLAYKWDPQSPDAKFLTRYTWYPNLSFDQLAGRAAAILAGPEHREPLAIVEALIQLAARRVRPEAVLYLEAAEDANLRLSFDINLYEARLQLAALEPLLARMGRHFRLPAEDLAALTHPAAADALGHLSGGIHRNGQAFFCVYYGVEGRGG